MRFRSCFIASSSLALGLLGACTNGQIGGEVGLDGDGQEASSDGCVDDATEALTAGETTSLGFSAGALMDAVEGKHTTTLGWLGSAGAARVTPGAGDAEITLTVTPDRSSAVLVHRKADTSQGEVAWTGDCGDEVRFDVHLVVRSDDGGLDAAFDTKLHADQAHLVLGNVDFASDGSQGSFSVTTSDDSAPSQTTLSFGFVDGTPSGALSGTLETTGDGAASASSLTYARFPLEDCAESYGYVLDADSDLGRRATELFVQAIDFDFTWQGSTTSTTLSVEPQLEGPLCFGSPMYPGQVVASLSTRVKSADGSIDATWQLQGQLELDATGAPSHVGIVRQAYMVDSFAAADFEAQSGISGVDLGDAEEASFSFATDRDVGARASGELTVLAGAGANCAAQTPAPADGGTSSPGCSGLDYQEITHASLAQRN